MDSNYIIERLKSTPFKYPTVNLIRTRLSNLDEAAKEEILNSLKKQLYRESNMDIQQQLSQLVYHFPNTSSFHAAS